MTLTQERAEEIIRALQPSAPGDQIHALAGQLRRSLGATSSRAAIDREDLLTRYTTELFIQHGAEIRGLRALLRQMLAETEEAAR